MEFASDEQIPINQNQGIIQSNADQAFGVDPNDSNQVLTLPVQNSIYQIHGRVKQSRTVYSEQIEDLKKDAEKM